MRVKFNSKILEMEGKMTAGQLLKKMGLLPEVALVARNGEVVTEDEPLNPADEVEVIRAISGGAQTPWGFSSPSPERSRGGGAEAAPQGAPRAHRVSESHRPIEYRIPIKQWPESDRPRERLLEGGPDVLSDAELVAILLRTGVKGHSALDLARTLLKEVGGLPSLLRADPGDLPSLKGLGPAKTAQVLAALEIGRRAGSKQVDAECVVRSSKDVIEVVAPHLRNLKKEALDVLFLNSRNKVLARERLSRGTVNRSSVYAREILERAIRHGASALILSHNHPSGDPAPSAEDEAVTRELVWAGELVNLCVLDHVIVGSDACFSFADEGRIDAFRSDARSKKGGAP